MTHWAVRKGAEGTNAGTSWTNAWNELDQISWASISAGDTIWIAAGTYTAGLRPGGTSTSGTAEARIYIKRVLTTDTDATALSGWSNDYAGNVDIDVDLGIAWVAGGTSGYGSYITIDGRTDDGTRCGIKSTSPGDQSWSAAVKADTGTAGVILQYIDAAGPAGSATYEHPANNNAVYWLAGSGRGTTSDFTMRYCRAHGCVTAMRLASAGATIEHNKFYDNVTTNSATYHNNIFSSNWSSGTLIFRFNTITNWDAEGIIIGATEDSLVQTWDIYGNVAYDSYHWADDDHSARFLEIQYQAMVIRAYNNTLVNCDRGFATRSTGDPWGSGTAIKNNIFYNVRDPLNEDYVPAEIRDYNAISGTNSETHGVANLPSDAFTDYANKDFSIVSTIGATYPRDKGVDLGESYNTDILGATRSVSWDIGAYEYGGVDQPAAGPSSITGGGSGSAVGGGGGTIGGN